MIESWVLTLGLVKYIPIKVKLHYAYKVFNIGRVRPRLRFFLLF